jgi:hypothetical protein
MDLFFSIFCKGSVYRLESIVQERLSFTHLILSDIFLRVFFGSIIVLTRDFGRTTGPAKQILSYGNDEDYTWKRVHSTGSPH